LMHAAARAAARSAFLRAFIFRELCSWRITCDCFWSPMPCCAAARDLRTILR